MAIYPETDKTVLEKIISGDEVSWQTFYTRYSPVVRTLCAVARLPETLFDDVVQEVMSRFARRSDTYVYAPERARFRTYFNHIVRAAIADQFRKLAKEERLAQGAVMPDPAEPAGWETAELEAWRAAVLDEALHELSSRVSAVNYLAFTMSALQGHSIRETAAFLDLAIPRVYQARSRCTAILQEIVSRCREADPGLGLHFPAKDV